MADGLNIITLQNILIRPVSVSPQGLYFTGKGFKVISEGIQINSGGHLDFHSYFNLISWNKWSKYADIKSLSLRLDLRGICEIIIFFWDLSGEKKDSYSTLVENDGITVIDIPSHLLSGQVSFEIIPAEDTLLISGAWVSTNLPITRNINMAGVICTYKKDEDLFGNLELINSNLPLNFEIYVIDNDSRLTFESVSSYGSEFHLIHNSNTGTSGGFARGIIEACSSKSNFSHILLMYDDIKLEPDTINRSITLLSHLKPEYVNYFLSGSMFMEDEPNKILEAPQVWNGFRIKSNKNELDILNPDTIGQLDRDSGSQNQYSSWSFCAFPLSKSIEETLPFPFFIYGDDIDYSFTHAEGFLSLNGISVWLKPVYKRFNIFFKSYFFCRNSLIVNSLHPSIFSIFSSMIIAVSHFIQGLLENNYLSAGFILMAVEDFLEGAEYVTALNEPELLKKYSVSDENITYTRSWIKIFELFVRGIIVSIRFIFLFKSASRSFRTIKRDKSFWTKRLYSRGEVVHADL